MAHSRETSHPILASVDNGVAAPCPRSREDCALWCFGLRRRRETTGSDGRSEVVAQLALAAAGCEVCDDVRVTQGDIGVLRDFPNEWPGMLTDAAPDIHQAAIDHLGTAAARFAPQLPTE